MMLVLNIICIAFFCIGIATVAAVIYFEGPRKVKEIRNRHCKIRFLCEHEYVRKCEWTSFEYDFSNYGVCRKRKLKFMKKRWTK